MNNAIEIQLKSFLEFLIFRSRLIQAGATVSQNEFAIMDVTIGLFEQIENNLGIESKKRFLAYAAKWPKFSGDALYPVGDITGNESAKQIYHRYTESKSNMLSEDTYSLLNWQIVCYVRDELKKDLQR